MIHTLVNWGIPFESLQRFEALSQENPGLQAPPQPAAVVPELLEEVFALELLELEEELLELEDELLLTEELEDELLETVADDELFTVPELPVVGVVELLVNPPVELLWELLDVLLPEEPVVGA